MTTKEIAEAVGKTERSVQGWAKKTGEKIASIGEKIASVQKTGKAVDYDVIETCSIIETGMGKNAADLFRMSAAREVAPRYADIKSLLSDRDIAMISQIVSVTVSETIKALDGRMTTIEHKIEERKALLPPPAIKPRDHINMLVRAYVEKNGTPHGQAWGELYRQFTYRTNTNPSTCAKNRGMAIIDYIESEGMIETLESIAIEVMK